MSLCVYCNSDKGKRRCPALGGLISAKCCGQHRGVEIDCPLSCHYYREHEEHIRGRLAPEFHESWLKAVTPLYQDRRAQLLDWIVVLEISIYSYFTQYSRGTDVDLVEALQYLKSKLSQITIIESPGSKLGQHLAEAASEIFESGNAMDPEVGQEGVELLIGAIEDLQSEESPRHALHGLLGHVEHFIGVPEDLKKPAEDEIETPKIILPGE